jgi:SNF2 family DNA or RNA helicase
MQLRLLLRALDAGAQLELELVRRELGEAGGAAPAPRLLVERWSSAEGRGEGALRCARVALRDASPWDTLEALATLGAVGGAPGAAGAVSRGPIAAELSVTSLAPGEAGWWSAELALCVRAERPLAGARLGKSGAQALGRLAMRLDPAISALMPCESSEERQAALARASRVAGDRFSLAAVYSACHAATSAGGLSDDDEERDGQGGGVGSLSALESFSSDKTQLELVVRPRRHAHERAARRLVAEEKRAHALYATAAQEHVQPNMQPHLQEQEQPQTQAQTQTQVGAQHVLPPLLRLPLPMLLHVCAWLPAACLQHARRTCKLLRIALGASVPGLRCDLYAHQKQALRWMDGREEGSAEDDAAAEWLLAGCGARGELRVAPSLAALARSPNLRLSPPLASEEDLVLEVERGVVVNAAAAGSLAGHTRGGLLCDEPGLGKTVTMLALVLRSVASDAAKTRARDALLSAEEQRAAQRVDEREAAMGSAWRDMAPDMRRSVAEELLAAVRQAVAKSARSSRDSEHTLGAHGVALTSLAAEAVTMTVQLQLMQQTRALGLRAGAAALVPWPDLIASWRELLSRSALWYPLELPAAKGAAFKSVLDAADRGLLAVASAVTTRFGPTVTEPGGFPIAARNVSAGSSSSTSSIPRLRRGSSTNSSTSSITSSSASSSTSGSTLRRSSSAGSAGASSGAPGESSPGAAAAGAVSWHLGGTLVVVPAPLLAHWKQQVARHVDARFFGREPLFWFDVAQELGKSPLPGAERLAGHLAVFTTTARLSQEASRSPASELLRVRWARVIVDEGHLLGSCALTNFSEMLGSLHSRCRWVMTGTPARESSLREGLRSLLGLLRFLRVHPFGLQGGTERWRALVQRPMEARRPDAVARLAALLSAVMVRHTKVDCAELPPLVLRKQCLELTAPERLSYNTIAAYARANIVLTGLGSKGADLSLLNAGNAKSALLVLRNLRLACAGGGRMRAAITDKNWAETRELLHRRYGASAERLRLANEFISRVVMGRPSECCDRGHVAHVSSSALAVLPLLMPCVHLICVECFERSCVAGLRFRCPACQQPFDPDDFAALQPGFDLRWEGDEDVDHAAAAQAGSGLDASSSKVEYIIRSLQRLRSERAAAGKASKDASKVKVIVFSQFREVLNALGHELILRFGPDAVAEFWGSRRDLELRKFTNEEATVWSCPVCGLDNEPIFRRCERQYIKVRCMVRRGGGLGGLGGLGSGSAPPPGDLHALPELELPAERLEGWFPGRTFREHERVALPAEARPAPPLVLVEARVTGLPRRCTGRVNDERARWRTRTGVDCFSLLLSRDGSTGLDLSMTSHIFLVDKIWDAAQEDQVVSRAWRLGATAPIIRVEQLYSQGTVEELMYDDWRATTATAHGARDDGDADGDKQPPPLPDASAPQDSGKVRYLLSHLQQVHGAAHQVQSKQVASPLIGATAGGHMFGAWAAPLVVPISSSSSSTATSATEAAKPAAPPPRKRMKLAFADEVAQPLVKVHEMERVASLSHK